MAVYYDGKSCIATYPCEFPAGAEGSKVEISTNTTTQVLTGSGILKHITVVSAGTNWVIAIYDDTDGTDNELFGWVTADGKGRFDIDTPVAEGIRVVTSGDAAGKVNVMFQAD